MHIRFPTVAAPPEKPLMLFDGDCHFCRRWIERWREATADHVAYEPFQTAAAAFPEIPLEECERAIKFIERDGSVTSGAEAVFRSLRYARGAAWLQEAYRRVPGFAFAAEFAYALAARNRMAASAATRWLWGNDVRRPTYFAAREWFLRSLGGIYFVAFLSLWTQVDGLIGNNGILPVDHFLAAARSQLGSEAPFVLPTLCWFSASNGFLHLLCAAGAAVSLLLVAGFAPIVCLLLLFGFYLSLTIAGQTFLSFQWDILLLETGFLAMFLAPLQWRPTRQRRAALPGAGLFLLKLLLFKLMLMSGVVKLTSGDDSWWNLTALDYHYWTQPLPTVVGWWADQHAEWIKKLSVAFTVVVEIVVPFFIWAPRRLRLLACATLVLLQVAIALTGNYSFFNLLTIALCLLLIDDRIWRRTGEKVEVARVSSSHRWIGVGATALLLPINVWLVVSAFRPDAEPPPPIEAAYRAIYPFHIASGYGLFRVMTKTRHEIVIEGSSDGVDWLPYEFKWKPGDPNRPPRWVAPHQPRLDWQMWFAALGTYNQNRWFISLLGRLLENSKDVTALLGRNPFPDAPPRYVRAKLYDYRFTTAEERRRNGAWWKREEMGDYCPEVSLRSD